MYEEHECLSCHTYNFVYVGDIVHRTPTIVGFRCRNCRCIEMIVDCDEVDPLTIVEGK